MKISTLNKPFILLSIDMSKSSVKHARTASKHIRDNLGVSPQQIEWVTEDKNTSYHMCYLGAVEFDYQIVKALKLLEQFQQASMIVVDNYRFGSILYWDDRDPEFLGRWTPCNEVTAKRAEQHFYYPKMEQYFIFKLET